MQATGSPALKEPAETLVELDHQELIIPVDFDEEELEAWMTELPTPCCSGGGGTSVICSAGCRGRPGPV